jgi:biotin carboxyl carrier protein
VFEVLSESIASLRVLAAALDPAVLTGAEAKQLVEQSAELERLAGAVRTLAAGRVAQTGAWIGPDGAFRDAGAWMASVTGTTVGRAKATIETAARLGALLQTGAALRSGALSPVQVDAIAAAASADPSAEPALLASAATDGVRGLKQACARVEAAASTDQVERYEAARERRGLWHRAVSDVEGHLEMRGPIDLTARVMAALEPIESELFEQARASGRRERPDALAFDALVQMADDSADVASCASGSRAPATVVVRVDAAALRRGATEAGEVCEIAGVGPIPAFVARRLAGDPILKVLVHDTTDVLAVSPPRSHDPGSAAHRDRGALPGVLHRGLPREPPPGDRPQHPGVARWADRVVEPDPALPLPPRPQARARPADRRRRHPPALRPGGSRAAGPVTQTVTGRGTPTSLRTLALPAVGEVTAGGRVVLGEAADLEVRVVRADRPVGDAEQAGRLEPEAAVVRGVAEEHDHRQARSHRVREQLGHERGPDAAALMAGRDRQRRDADDRPSVQVAPRTEDVTDHDPVVRRNEVEAVGRGGQGPSVGDDPDLLVPVPSRVGERVHHEREHCVVVRRRRRPHDHRFVPRSCASIAPCMSADRTGAGYCAPMAEIRAEITANVWQVVAEEGQMVAEGDEICILESMKMEIPVITEVPGVVRELHVEPEQVVQEGDLIALIDES